MLVFVMPFQFCNHLNEEEVSWLLCFYCFLDVLLLKRLVALPHGAVVWSSVCDCGIS